MNNDVGYRLRLKVRTGKPFFSDKAVPSVSVADRSVSIHPDGNEQPYSNANWILFVSSGFPTENAALEFGEKLQTIVEIAALCSHLGADTGLGETLSWFNEDVHREMGDLNAHQRIAPDIHGISVVPDDDNNVFLRAGIARGTTKTDPVRFTDSVETLANQEITTTSDLKLPIQLLNLALINPDSLAIIVLANSAVDSVISDSSWSDKQSKLIKSVAECLRDDADEEEDIIEVAESIKHMRLSLRKGVKHLLSENGLDDLLWKDWDDMYSRRSKLIHHGKGPFSQQELNTLAQDSIRICGTIILAIIRQQGIELPSITQTHFRDLIGK